MSRCRKWARWLMAAGLAWTVPAEAQPVSSDLVSTLRVVYRPPGPDFRQVPPAGGLVVDVIWCSDDASATTRASAASELAGSYAAIVKLVFEGGGGRIREIRTRGIAKDSVVKGLTSRDIETLQTDPLVPPYDIRDGNAQDFVHKVLPLGLVPAKVSPTKADIYLPNYVSVLICSETTAQSIRGRLVMHVKEPDQLGDASDAARFLQKKYPLLAIAPQIEVVPEISPRHSELRYFFPEDLGIATSIATALTKEHNMAVVPKLIRGYELKVRRGSLEVWFVDDKR
jgi:hypothetical protein